MAMTPPNGPTTGNAIGRRGFLAAIVALPLALPACSSTKGGDAVEVSTSAFPLSLSHSFGTTTVAAPPKRVVALSSADADACAALGLAPVGISGSASSPWFTAAMRDIDGAPPFLLSDKIAMPLDDIRNLDPDVILAVGAGISRTDYDKLSQIAPVCWRRQRVPARLGVRPRPSSARRWGAVTRPPSCRPRPRGPSGIRSATTPASREPRFSSCPFLTDRQSVV